MSSNACQDCKDAAHGVADSRTGQSHIGRLDRDCLKSRVRHCCGLPLPIACRYAMIIVSGPSQGVRSSWTGEFASSRGSQLSATRRLAFLRLISFAPVCSRTQVRHAVPDDKKLTNGLLRCRAMPGMADRTSAIPLRRANSITASGSLMRWARRRLASRASESDAHQVARRFQAPARLGSACHRAACLGPRGSPTHRALRCMFSSSFVLSGPVSPAGASGGKAASISKRLRREEAIKRDKQVRRPSSPSQLTCIPVCADALHVRA